MILILEIGLFVFGIVTLVRGRMSTSRHRSVYGTPARVIGVIALLTLPLILLISFCIGFLLAASRVQVDGHLWLFALIDIGVLLLVGLVIALISWNYAQDEPGVHEWRRFEWQSRHAPAAPPPAAVAAGPPEQPPPLLAVVPVEPPPLQCPTCAVRLKVAPELAGKKIRCSKCQTVMTVPEAARATDAISQGPPPPRQR